MKAPVAFVGALFVLMNFSFCVAQIPSGPISVGEKSQRVSALQNMLMGLTYPISATGAFGKHTKGFVSQFQKDEGLASTGIVDKSTVEKLIERVLKAPIKVCMETGASYAANFLLPAETGDKFMREFYLTTAGEAEVKRIQQEAGIDSTGEIDAPTLLAMFKIDGESTAPRQNVNDLESRESGYGDGPVSYRKDPKVSVYDGPPEGEEDPECRGGGGGGRRPTGGVSDPEGGSEDVGGDDEEMRGKVSPIRSVKKTSKRKKGGKKKKRRSRHGRWVSHRRL